MHKTDSRYDVAITGGGLAGLTLAIQCADAGYTTVLLEKETYPFHKVCGEYISFESLPFLQRIGFAAEQFQLPFIKQLRLSDINGNLYGFSLPLGGFGISRYTLDNHLFRLAVSKGVDVRHIQVTDIHFTGDSFDILTAKQAFRAKTAAGCFGKRSNLDIKWKRSFTRQKPDKLNNYIGVKYHIQYPFPKEIIALHNFSNGYCGISNIENDTCCLCYLTTAGNLKKNGSSIPQMEQQVLWQNPLLKNIFREARFLYPEPLAISQVSFDKKLQVENHVLMVGDAAGLITPLCGNGMSMALHASLLAFKNIQAFIEGKINRHQMETSYTQQWQTQFSGRLRMGRAVQRLFGNNFSTSLFLKIMGQTKWLAGKIIRSTHGEAF